MTSEVIITSPIVSVIGAVLPLFFVLFHLPGGLTQIVGRSHKRLDPLTIRTMQRRSADYSGNAVSDVV